MWSRRSVFILAAIGSAVGLGNIWRFPYVAYANGGGAFIIPYLIALLTAGIPLLFLDYAIGHKFRGSPPLAFKRLRKRTEAIGWWQVGICFVISVYYAVIIAWALRYTFFSLTRAWGDDAEGFFVKDFLKQSDANFGFDYVGNVAWPLILVWVGVIAILAFGVQKGIGAISRIFVPVLILLFLAVVVRALFLPGAAAGLDAFFTPDWSALTNTSVWIAAYGQIFFSLSVAFGIMVTYSSYLKRKTNLTGSGLVVGFSNSAFEILAGIGVFAALGFMAFQAGEPVSEVVDGGIGLAFIAFPTIISQMPGGALFGFLFFGSLVFAGFTSLISISQVVIAAVEDKLSLGTVRSTLLVGGASAIVSVALFPTTTGLNLLDVVDHFVNSFGIVTVALVAIVTVSWLLRSLPALQLHLNSVSSFKLGRLWQVCVGLLTPIVLGYMMISEFVDVIRNGYGGLPTVLVVSAGWAVQVAIIVFAILLSLTPWRHYGDRVPEYTDPVPAGAVK
ncbi:sodium-dependent transporter [Tomitella biformata]|uniref:sodium-dependent transporter n=1 Tax=Tomitella biformata TaxID=630403 RepID=UPI0011DD9D4F|nr:sodium-dependent transporter [Tomitella biformata]